MIKKHKDLHSFVDRYNDMQKDIAELKKPIESEPSEVIDIGEKYQIVTGMDEDKAGGVDPRLMPNLHHKWMPSELWEGKPYNDKLYKDAAEQEFYETFIQPLFKIYKFGLYTKHSDAQSNIMRHNWEKKINIEALGPEKALFERDNDSKRSLSVGEIETTLILTVHLIDNLYRYRTSKIAKRFGSSTAWVNSFRKKIQKAYGRMAAISIEDHVERQLGRCEGILDTFITKARGGDPYAAKVVKDYIELEDKYIIPTVEQLSAKDSQENKEETIKRLEEIFTKRIENKNEK